MDDIDEFLDSTHGDITGELPLSSFDCQQGRKQRDKTNARESVHLVNLSKGERELMESIKRGRPEQTERILESKKVDVNFRDSFQRTPLMRACYSDRDDVRQQLVRILLEHGADVNIRDNHGRTTLMVACMEENKVDVIRLLVENEHLDPNIQDESGNTALIHAVKHGNTSAVQTLVTSPHMKGLIDVKQENHHGNTPLLVAVKLMHKECCKILLNEGGDSLGANSISAPTSPKIEKNASSQDRGIKYGGLPRGTRVNLPLLRLRQFSEDIGRTFLQSKKDEVDLTDTPADDGASYRLVPMSPIPDITEEFLKKQTTAAKGERLFIERVASNQQRNSTDVNTLGNKLNVFQRSFSDTVLQDGHQMIDERLISQRPATGLNLSTRTTVDEMTVKLKPPERLSRCNSPVKSPRVSSTPSASEEPIHLPNISQCAGFTMLSGANSRPKDNVQTETHVTKQTSRTEKKTTMPEKLSLEEIATGSFSTSLTEREDDIHPLKTFDNTERLLRRKSKENIFATTDTDPSPPASDSERRTSSEFLTDVFQNRDKDILYEKTKKRLTRPSSAKGSMCRRNSLNKVLPKSAGHCAESSACIDYVQSSRSEPTVANGPSLIETTVHQRRKHTREANRHHPRNDGACVGASESTTHSSHTPHSIRRKSSKGMLSTTDDNGPDTDRRAGKSREPESNPESRWSTEKYSRGRRVVVYKTKSGKIIHPNVSRDPMYPKILATRRKSQTQIGQPCQTRVTRGKQGKKSKDEDVRARAIHC